jgi:hypothetical protein
VDDGRIPPSSDEGWDDLGELYADLISEVKQSGVVHLGWLQELVDAQAYRGHTGVVALSRSWREAGRTPPTLTLRSHMDVAIEESAAIVNLHSDGTLPDGR